MPGGRPPNAWTKAIYELLSDGEWHEYEECMQVGMAQVLPSQAIRRREARRGVKGFTDTYNKDAYQKVLTGKRDLARRAIYFANLRNRVEIKLEGGKKYVRANPNSPDEDEA